MDTVKSDFGLKIRKRQRKVELIKGNIAQLTRADVLVNPVPAGRSKIDLKCSGEVSRAFYELGQDDLQKDFEKAGLPEKFGKDLTATGPAGSIAAKRIFYPALGDYRNDNSLKLFTEMIKICLKKVESEHLTSIAFPTVGCGKYGYDATDVALCFLEAANETNIKIYIVAYTEELRSRFDQIFKTVEESERQSVNLSTAPDKSSSPLSLTMSSSSFKTDSGESSENSVSNSREKNYPPPSIPSKPKKAPPPKPIPRPRASIKQRADNSFTKANNSTVQRPTSIAASISIEAEIVIKYPTNVDLKSGIMTKIKDLQSENVQIQIDTDQSTVTLIGNKLALYEVKQRILKFLAEEEMLQKDLSHIKRTQGVKEYLLALAQRQGFRFPLYWKNSTFTDLSSTESGLHSLVSGSQVYDAVENFVHSTWDSSLVGQGRDAIGLNHSGIVIKKISMIENPFLYTSYQSKLKNFALKASRKPFPAITELHGEQEISTNEIPGSEYLNSQLISEVNEVYLFHGSSHVDEIVKDGVDSRYCGDGVLFGRGAYFAESSTKSDQYADNRLCRANLGDRLFMFLARVVLGRPFICQKPRHDLKKAPCSTDGCHRHDCIDSQHTMCDSVIGTRKDDTSRLLFREFVVYHPEQCYPEFLVEYERV